MIVFLLIVNAGLVIWAFVDYGAFYARVGDVDRLINNHAASINQHAAHINRLMAQVDALQAAEKSRQRAAPQYDFDDWDP